MKKNDRLDQTFKPIAILGAGSWGTALALNLARRGQVVRLWSIDPEEINAMLTENTNSRFLPGYQLPPTLLPTAKLEETVKDVEEFIIAVPSVGLRNTMDSLKAEIDSATKKIICASKGLDTHTGQLSHEIAAEVFGQNCRFGVLSGPSFAKEVAAGLPTAVVIASHDATLTHDLAARFESPIFHVVKGEDVVGVELGGIIKNVIAIATGISDGMSYGNNTRSAIITHGLSEMIRLGQALGGQLETFIGLSGLGDLILTCSDNQSRNRRLGLAIGQEQAVQEAEKQIGQVVEGKRNAELVYHLAQRHQVNMPVCEAVYKVLLGLLTAQEAIMQILNSTL
jgi:glycerol-3-phosphate dehydrogenase (NAD(P)+)